MTVQSVGCLGENLNGRLEVSLQSTIHPTFLIRFRRHITRTCLITTCHAFIISTRGFSFQRKY